MRLVPIILVLTMGATIYVDDDAPVGGNGAGWPTAYKYLQDALAVAVAGDEIRVAQGTYKPDQDEAGNVTPGDREATFQPRGGVTLRSGYAGIGRPNPDARDVGLYATILSGDLAGDDGPDFANHWENSYHVVMAIGCAQRILVDGFTITAGNTSVQCPWPSRIGPHPEHTESGPASGAGAFIIDNDDIAFTNCVFVRNWADRLGGGLFSGDNGLTLTDCAFIGNAARNDGALSHFSGILRMTNCTFTGNSGGHVFDPHIPGDLNDDGVVDVADLLLMAQVWGSCVGDSNFNPEADLNNDGRVNLPDLLISAQYWDKAMKERGK